MTQNITTIACSNVTDMIAFYCDLLGLKLLYAGPDSAELKLGETVIQLQETTAPAKQAAALIIEVSHRELDYWYRELLRRYVEIVEAPTDRGHGYRAMYFKDPQGNVIQMYAYISL